LNSLSPPSRTIQSNIWQQHTSSIQSGEDRSNEEDMLPRPSALVDDALRLLTKTVLISSSVDLQNLVETEEAITQMKRFTFFIYIGIAIIALLPGITYLMYKRYIRNKNEKAMKMRIINYKKNLCALYCLDDRRRRKHSIEGSGIDISSEGFLEDGYGYDIPPMINANPWSQVLTPSQRFDFLMKAGSGADTPTVEAREPVIIGEDAISNHREHMGSNTTTMDAETSVYLNMETIGDHSNHSNNQDSAGFAALFGASSVSSLSAYADVHKSDSDCNMTPPKQAEASILSSAASDNVCTAKKSIDSILSDKIKSAG
jgi:hypothetical protein